VTQRLTEADVFHEMSRRDPNWNAYGATRHDAVLLALQAFVALSTAQQEGAAAEPDGWKLVPVEPTEEMCRAAVVFANGSAVYKAVAAEALKIEESIYAEVYEAMLSAAPTQEGPAEPAAAWIDPHESLPQIGEEVLVYSMQPWEKAPSIKLDTWDEQREAPLSFSTETIPIGPGWDEHDDFEAVLAWMRLPTVPPMRAPENTR
jgi:hypothetical protein